MRNSYKVIVWGPGAVGSACLRELYKRPEFEIVGVLAYSESKNGMDIGRIAGADSNLGVKVTTDKEAIIALDADCVIWSGTLPWADVRAEMDEYVVRLLESGKNVITPVAYHYPELHGADYMQRLDGACKKGNSSLHGTGENPGFWLERVGVTLTGLCNHVEFMQLDEYLDLAMTGSDLLPSMGFGMPEAMAAEFAEKGPLATMFQNLFYIESMNLVSRSIYGCPIDDFEYKYRHFLAESAFELSKANGDPVDVSIPESTVYAQSYSLTGYIAGEPRFGISLNWFLLPEHSPFEGKEDSTWDIVIEGTPTSVRSTFKAMASVKRNLDFLPGDSTSPSWYATAMPCIQAIPVVCAHDPGIVYPSVFAQCVDDYRILESRKSIVA
ncbi:MAG: hypothetical protein RID07_00410 [Lacipirellulaceae bacterium]|uniref:NAD(P)H-dependent amine dehydrogenase family protein n=1 Tax=Marinobacter salarius TaxID=1420917 RepID=UPI0032ED2115